MLTPPRPRFLVGLALGFLLTAALVALVGPSLPALAQSGRAAVVAPPLEPFQAQGTPQLGPVGPQQFDLSPAVPAGKLLVVESLYALVQVSTGETAAAFVSGADGEVTVPLGLAFQGTLLGADLYTTTSPAARLYLPAGPLRGVFGTSPSATILGTLTVVGHLVPATAP